MAFWLEMDRNKRRKPMIVAAIRVQRMFRRKYRNRRMDIQTREAEALKVMRKWRTNHRYNAHGSDLPTIHGSSELVGILGKDNERRSGLEDDEELADILAKIEQHIDQSRMPHYTALIKECAAECPEYLPAKHRVQQIFGHDLERNERCLDFKTLVAAAVKAHAEADATQE